LPIRRERATLAKAGTFEKVEERDRSTLCSDCQWKKLAAGTTPERDPRFYSE